MLKMLQGHMMGDNKNRFAMATDHLVTPVIEWGPPPTDAVDMRLRLDDSQIKVLKIFETTAFSNLSAK